MAVEKQGYSIARRFATFFDRNGAVFCGRWASNRDPFDSWPSPWLDVQPIQLLKKWEKGRKPEFFHKSAFTEIEEHLALTEELPEEGHGIESVDLNLLPVIV